MSTSDSGDVNKKAVVEELEKGTTVQVSSLDKHLTRRVLLKLDTRFCPTIFFIYLFFCLSPFNKSEVENA